MLSLSLFSVGLSLAKFRSPNVAPSVRLLPSHFWSCLLRLPQRQRPLVLGPSRRTLLLEDLRERETLPHPSCQAIALACHR